MRTASIQLAASLMLFLTGSLLRAQTGSPTGVIMGCVQTGSSTGVSCEKGAGYEPVGGAVVHLFSASVKPVSNQEQKTGPDGWYVFVNLPPAPDYVLEVIHPGFEPNPYQWPELISLAIAGQLKVMPPINLERRIGVQPPPPTPPLPPPPPPPIKLDLLSAVVSGVIESRTIRTLPLVGRDFIDLTLLVPGSYPVEQGSNLEGASLVVNGARASMNNFLLDGADDNDYTINQSLPFQIVEAMQEFRVQTSTSPAEFGRSAGAQINTASRSGSDVFHGALFEFLRNSASAANNFFSAYNGGTFDQYARFLRVANLLQPNQYPVSNPLADPTLAAYYERRRPLVVQNQFGGNVGGPLIKEKIFGFFNYEGFRVSNPRPIFERVPGLNLRQLGPEFSTTQTLYGFYPLPNVPPSPGVTDATTFAFFVGESANWTSSDNLLGRIDWKSSESSNMSFKYNVQQIGQVQGGAVPRTPSYPGSGTRLEGRNQNFSFNYLQQSSRVSNELRVAWNRFHLAASALDNTVPPSLLDLQNLNFLDRGLPNLFVGGQIAGNDLGPFATLGADRGIPSSRADNVWSLADNVSFPRRNHLWTLGAEYRRIGLNTLDEGLGRGFFTFFSGEFSAANNQPDVASIARVSSQFGGGFDRYLRTWSLDWFIQDQWRPRPNFTLNYGVRYEVNIAPVEARNRMVNYYPALGGLVRAGDTTLFDTFGNVIGKAPQPAPRGGFETDKNNFAPRVGFAWDPMHSGKTVLRGAYALVYDQQPLQPEVNMLLNPPFVYQDFSFFPRFTLADTFGHNSSSSTWYTLPYSTTAIDPNTRTSYVHQFNIGIQRQLGKAPTRCDRSAPAGCESGVFELAYVGSAGHKLPRLVDLKDCPLAAVLSNPTACFDPTATNPFKASSVLDQQSTANSNFHSLQARFQTRNLRGLQIQLHYQWAKSIDSASSMLPQVFLVSPGIATLLVSDSQINPENFAAANNISPTLSLRPTLPIITTRPRLPQDSSNLAGERARSDFDVAHRFVASYIYSVPKWDRGGKLLGEGWQFAGITTIQSGQPFTVFDDFFGIPLRPDQLHSPVIDLTNPQATIDNANIVGSPPGNPPSAFGLASSFQLKPGNLGRNSFTGPGLVNFDFSVLKNTRLGKGEGKTIQLRAEFFNLFNHTNFLQPYSRGGLLFVDQGQPSLLPDPFFGQMLQAHPGRAVQFAIKFTF